MKAWTGVCGNVSQSVAALGTLELYYIPTYVPTYSRYLLTLGTYLAH